MSRRSGGHAATLLVLAYLGFVSLGLPDGLLGVGWPSMRADFGVGLSAVGFVLTVFTGGYLFSSVAAGFILARVGVGWLLAASTALASLALTGYAAAPVLAVVVGFSLLLGLGSGAIDSGLNAYAAGHFGARHMNWLHASFGLGATIGPLVMTGVLDAGLAWRWGYGLVALAQALLAIAFVSTGRVWDGGLAAADGPGAPGPSVGAEPVAPAGRVRQTLANPTVWLGVITFAVYTGIEIAAGLWAYTLLTGSRGMAPGPAGLWVSAYWASLLVGRLVMGLIADRIGPVRLLRTGMLGMAAGAALLAVPVTWCTVTGLVLIGASAAPVFPLLTLTTSARVGAAHADRAVGLQIGGAGLGGVAIPAAAGVLIGRYGADVLGAVLLVLAVVLIVTHLATRARTAETPADQGQTHAV